MDVSRRNQIGNQGSLESKREESPEECGIICRDGLSKYRDVDDLPDLCLLIPEPVATEYQVIQDPENDVTRKVDDNQPEKKNYQQQMDWKTLMELLSQTTIN